MSVYYNEFSKQKAAWLRHLIEEGEIAHGVVDERSITEVQPEDLAGFAQCHFFAGIGLWSLCLRRAGWPDDRPVWTGSCPCGPFSEAGLGKGFEDERHLWPEWFRLIGQCRPDVVFGEQSANAIEWLDLVSGDLEGAGYAIGTPDIPAAGFGGAHRRQRFGFVADTDNTVWWSDRAPWNDGQWPKTGWVQGPSDFGDGSASIWMGDAGRPRSTTVGPDNGQVRSFPEAQRQPEQRSALPWRPGATICLADSNSDGRTAGSGWKSIRAEHDPQYGGGPDWVFCRDGNWRPVEPGTSPLTDAHPRNLVLLHGYGDGIDVEAFTQLISAYLEVAPARRLAA
jgi:DNA (cytosine-5)-methyltransferase 1